MVNSPARAQTQTRSRGPAPAQAAVRVLLGLWSSIAWLTMLSLATPTALGVEAESAVRAAQPRSHAALGKLPAEESRLEEASRDFEPEEDDEDDEGSKHHAVRRLLEADADDEDRGVDGADNQTCSYGDGLAARGPPA